MPSGQIVDVSSKLCNFKFVFQVVLEIRPRLGSVNAYITGIEKTLSTVLISPAQDSFSIVLQGDDIPIDIPLKEFVKKFGKIASNSIHALSCQKDHISFRCKLQGSQLSLLLPEINAFPRKKLKKPCNLSIEDEGKVSKVKELRCSNCQNLISRVNLERFLPLPASDWRQGTRDWFCACSHTSTLDQACKGGSDEKSPMIANRRVHQERLGPRESDLLYSHCQILLHSKHLPSLSCQSCQNKLGDRDEKDDFVQLWHHSVILGIEAKLDENPVTTSSSSALLETFLLCVGGICADHDWIPLKIRLRCNNDQLLLWMLEPNLHVLKMNSNEMEEEFLGLMKVMHTTEPYQDSVDQELNVPSDVIAAGVGHLQENSAMIPPGQRRDSNFYISYISLNAVLERRT